MEFYDETRIIVLPIKIKGCDMKGFSIYFCFGKYAGFKKEISSDIFRVVLGWFSFAVMFVDIEMVFKNTIENNRELQEYKIEEMRAKIK